MLNDDYLSALMKLMWNMNRNRQNNMTAEAKYFTLVKDEFNQFTFILTPWHVYDF